jgi:hypothetical protein
MKDVARARAIISDSENRGSPIWTLGLYFQSNYLNTLNKVQEHQNYTFFVSKNVIACRPFYSW